MMTRREFLLKILRKTEERLDPPYKAATPEQRLLDAIFVTPENHPWPEEVQPMPGNFWRGDLDEYDWASYVGDCVKARTSTPLGMLQVAHSILITAALRTKDNDAGAHEAARAAEKVLCVYLDSLEDAPSYYYDPKFGDERTCRCGHPYRRHFDTYEDMEPIGCKYCGCFSFAEPDEPVT